MKRLRVPLADLVVLDQCLGGVAMAPACLQLAEQVLATIRRHTICDRVRRALHATAGRVPCRCRMWAAIDA